MRTASRDLGDAASEILRDALRIFYGFHVKRPLQQRPAAAPRSSDDLRRTTVPGSANPPILRAAFRGTVSVDIHFRRNGALMKWFAAIIPTIALGAIVAATAFAAAPRHATVTIHHETKGCHAWALGTGAFTAHVN